MTLDPVGEYAASYETIGSRMGTGLRLDHCLLPVWVRVYCKSPARVSVWFRRGHACTTEVQVTEQVVILINVCFRSEYTCTTRNTIVVSMSASSVGIHVPHVTGLSYQCASGVGTHVSHVIGLSYQRLLPASVHVYHT